MKLTLKLPGRVVDSNLFRCLEDRLLDTLHKLAPGNFDYDTSFHDSDTGSKITLTGPNDVIRSKEITDITREIRKLEQLSVEELDLNDSSSDDEEESEPEERTEDVQKQGVQETVLFLIYIVLRSVGVSTDISDVVIDGLRSFLSNFHCSDIIGTFMALLQNETFLTTILPMILSVFRREKKPAFKPWSPLNMSQDSGSSTTKSRKSTRESAKSTNKRARETEPRQTRETGRFAEQKGTKPNEGIRPRQEDSSDPKEYVEAGQSVQDLLSGLGFNASYKHGGSDQRTAPDPEVNIPSFGDSVPSFTGPRPSVNPLPDMNEIFANVLGTVGALSSFFSAPGGTGPCFTNPASTAFFTVPPPSFPGTDELHKETKQDVENKGD